MLKRQREHIRTALTAGIDGLMGEEEVVDYDGIGEDEEEQASLFILLTKKNAATIDLDKQVPETESTPWLAQGDPLLFLLLNVSRPPPSLFFLQTILRYPSSIPHRSVFPLRKCHPPCGFPFPSLH